MAVTRLALTDFRSHGRLLIEPGPGLVVLTGENGAGKTNLLEALSLLAPGRGLRGAALSEMARTGGPGGFAVAARLDAGSGEPIDIGTGTEAQAPERRVVRINSAPAAANTLAEWLSLVWLTPAMDRLFVDTPGGRRRFLDRLVLALDPAHAAHATRYEAAVRDRNRLLSEETPPDPVWLDALEAAMAEHGDAVAQARARLVAALNDRIAAEPEGPFARPTLDIGGWNGSDLAVELRQGRGRDRAAGRTLSGPHRSDLIVTHATKGQPAARSSTGEQKALLLSLILAHADLVAERKGARPILLLDEVAAHLDPGRRAALFERLAAGGGQIWMTGTEPALFEGADAWRMQLP
ncbi:DNA replication/repair protein RecF [Sphingomonas crocodyli]|uniref:DNA replication and repair protein RecF n=1 Tax=Sphingomonas crocodyli TaxID=1979270 RepID=A0A437M4L0_9SPHN|nr:DNA replication/repair protein RecF [Sphingomonas crocodyli]RVT92661.1 DNA replication/repair protein RecF [Sphingomonas crocodyli]